MIGFHVVSNRSSEFVTVTYFLYMLKLHGSWVILPTRLLRYSILIEEKKVRILLLKFTVSSELVAKPLGSKQ